ncbi:MAG: hypothetical protein KatS3mg111_3824 [Pirellulaceae bacterium]|nr:MAG: hypothetical protein KatS3mg111_3824 [Pirellulaceae bacterium]
MAYHSQWITPIVSHHTQSMLIMAVPESNYAVAAIVVLGARIKRSTCVAAIAACMSGVHLLGGCLIGGNSIVAGSEPPAAGSPSTSGAVDSTVDEYLVLPAELRLDGYGARANLLVQRVEDGRVGEQVQPLRVEVDDPAVAEIVDGQVVARGNGQTQVVVTVESQHRDRPPSSFQMPVRVYRASQPMDVEFVAHVESILSKRGCNSGACHGALAGKGGLRLSLRGYDPVADHFAITRQDRGRRIEPAEPGRSLLLTKPTGVVPHKGGVRLESDSSDFQLLARWIAKGFPGPKADQAVLEEIEVLPAEVRLAVGQRQQIVVRAHYGDGRIEDVTQWAKFSSADETVARVDADGKVSVVGHGRGAVVAWFASRIALARITVPYQQKVVDEEYASFAPQNLIDEILWEEWKTLRLSPSPPCSDATFLRRACLDATGRLPTAEEVADFLADPAPDKRQRLVDHLLASEGFVDYWSYKWSDLLLINGTPAPPRCGKGVLWLGTCAGRTKHSLGPHGTADHSGPGG